MKRWQQLLEESRRSVDELKERLHLSDEEVEAFKAVEEHYPVLISPYYLRLMSPWDASDPIRRMCIPKIADADASAVDAVQDTSIKGGQHKYLQSVLIVSNNDTLSYARRCYRKDFTVMTGDEASMRIPKLAEYIGDHTEIDNISIGGGDAFLNDNARIAEYLKAFAFLPSVDYIRFTTSTPATFPQRITEDNGELLGLLSRYSKAKAIVVVTQFNHPRELTDDAAAAVRALHEAGCTLRNESVLLHGVNDDPETLLALMNGLVAMGIEPYYLYQCRPKSAVADDFHVPIAAGMRAVIGAKGKMSGMAKTFRYIMSHSTGKIEMVGFLGDGKAVFKYHEAREDADQGRLFTQELTDDQVWINL